MTTRSVPCGSSVSACQTIAGSRPDTSRSVRAMSRSRLMPGKTRTAAFIVTKLSADNVDVVILNPLIRQQPISGLLQEFFRLAAVADAVDLDVEHLALAHAGDALDAERAQRAFDRLALRIENAGFQRDGDARFHRIPTQKGGPDGPPVASLRILLNLMSRVTHPFTSTGPVPCGRSPSLMIPRRFATSVWPSPSPPRSRRKRSLSSFSFDLMSHSRQESGEISSATTMRMVSFSHKRPASILKSTRRIPTPRKRPERKSLTRMASAMMSSISCGLAQPNAVMCSSDTIGSLSLSFL